MINVHKAILEELTREECGLEKKIREKLKKDVQEKKLNVDVPQRPAVENQGCLKGPQNLLLGFTPTKQLPFWM